MTYVYILLSIFAFFFYSIIIIIADCLNEELNLREIFSVIFKIFTTKNFLQYLNPDKNTYLLKNLINTIKNERFYNNYLKLFLSPEIKTSIKQEKKTKKIKLEIENNDFFSLQKDLKLHKIEACYGN